MIAGRLTSGVALIARYLLLCAFVTWRHHRRQRLQAAAAAQLLPAADSSAPMLVLHASQTGQAEEIAWQTARALHVAGLPVRLAVLGEITLDELRAAPHALFIVST